MRAASKKTYTEAGTQEKQCRYNQTDVNKRHRDRLKGIQTGKQIVIRCRADR